MRFAAIALLALPLAACGNSSPSCNTPTVAYTLEEIDFKRRSSIVEDFWLNGVMAGPPDKITMKLDHVRTRSQKKNFTECAAQLVYDAPINEIRESKLWASDPRSNFTVIPQPRPDWSTDKWKAFVKEKLSQNITYTVERDDDGKDNEIVITGRF